MYVNLSICHDRIIYGLNMSGQPALPAACWSAFGGLRTNARVSHAKHLVENRGIADTRPQRANYSEIHVDKPCWETTTKNPGRNRTDILNSGTKLPPNQGRPITNVTFPSIGPHAPIPRVTSASDRRPPYGNPKGLMHGQPPSRYAYRRQEAGPGRLATDVWILESLPGQIDRCTSIRQSVMTYLLNT